jgi:hypothetical protein
MRWDQPSSRDGAAAGCVCDESSPPPPCEGRRAARPPGCSSAPRWRHATGIGRTGRLVTSAALNPVLLLLRIATSPATDTRVLGTALGVGILIDATIVRALLAPALVSLFGRWNWWLPGWLARALFVEPSPLHPVRIVPPEALPEPDKVPAGIS